MYRRPSIVAGGHMPGTAQLAVTASTKLTPDPFSNTRGAPLSASTATIFNARTGHSWDGSRDSITARRSGSGTVAASSANLPTARRMSGMVEAFRITPAISATKLSRSMLTAISVVCSSGSTCQAYSSSTPSPLPSCAATVEPADVPTITSAPVTSWPTSVSPASNPVIHATPPTPPPPSTNASAMSALAVEVLMLNSTTHPPGVDTGRLSMVPSDGSEDARERFPLLWRSEGLMSITRGYRGSSQAIASGQVPRTLAWLRKAAVKGVRTRTFGAALAVHARAEVRHDLRDTPLTNA